MLPNGDILVAEGRGGNAAKLKPKDVIAGYIKAKGNTKVKGGDRLTLLRDADGDGVYELQTVFADKLNAPYGLAFFDNKLYVADTGNKRILALDPSLGQPVAPFPGTEIIAERRYFEAPVKVVASGGVLEQPSGLEASGGLAFVTDAKTSMIHAFDLATGDLVRSLDTGLAPGSLAGLNFGPDGKIYFVDRKASRVYRIDP